jgi:hypothetical protein
MIGPDFIRPIFVYQLCGFVFYDPVPEVKVASGNHENGVTANFSIVLQLELYRRQLLHLFAEPSKIRALAECGII